MRGLHLNVRAIILIALLFLPFCKSIQRGGEQKALEISKNLDDAAEDLDDAEEELEKSSATPEQKASIKSKIQSGRAKVLEQRPAIVDIGKASDTNADIADKLQAQVKELELYYWVFWGAVALIGLGLALYGKLKTSLWLSVLGGLITAAALAMGIKRVFF